jgi:hypothetical protein
MSFASLGSPKKTPTPKRRLFNAIEKRHARAMQLPDLHQ